METGSAFDAAPWALPLDEALGLAWDDPREIHRVVVHFESSPPTDLKLQYWRRRWPASRIPKDRVPEGGSVGWWELGNWYVGEWQTADAEVSVQGTVATFTFRPVNAKEFPDVTDFPARFRTTFKIRILSDPCLPEAKAIQAFTDSIWRQTLATVMWQMPPTSPVSCEAFNGRVESVISTAPDRQRVAIWGTENSDPNTFDQTLLTIHGDITATVRVADLAAGPVAIPDLGLCVVAGEDDRDLLDILSEIHARSLQGLHQAVSNMPEQTWSRAWSHMVPKRKPICLPLGTDGGRHHFRLDPDGSFAFRTNNPFLTSCPGQDTPRLQKDKAKIHVSFDLPAFPKRRSLEDGILPMGVTEWEASGIEVEQRAFVTVLDGICPEGPPPAADALGVLLCRFTLRNPSDAQAHAELPIRFSAEETPEDIRLDDRGGLWAQGAFRGLLAPADRFDLSVQDGRVACRILLPPKTDASLTLKIPYVSLDTEEIQGLAALDFDAEWRAAKAYWTRRLSQGARLLTPEPDLNGFYQAHVGHLLINCEKEPGSDRRFARVGSFHYGVFGNEACMMIVDLDRRGYHEEARQCLDAFMAYQGTVPLPGDYSSQEGVFYGTAGYECGGYNQHHGWILWCLAEHFAFTRDEAWLKRAAPHLLAGADWILRERHRTLARPDLGAGLLPHGSLEDVGDWWQWLSTNAYSWRGLNRAGHALSQIAHREADRLVREAVEYRQSILHAFLGAAERSPVMRLRDGAFVPHIPSHPQRRGRSFGWICETLEGAIHLLIAGVIESGSPQGDWIVRDYEDNLYLSPHTGYAIEDFDKNWFDQGGFSMQACLLFHVEPYLYRDEPKHALRGLFNGIAANYFPDVQMCCEHALPRLGDWVGDHYKSSDEANATGWLRKIFAREDGDELVLGQAIPRDWFREGLTIGMEEAATHFGPMDCLFRREQDRVTASLRAPQRHPPSAIRLRFGLLQGDVSEVTVNGKLWQDWDAKWIRLPGAIGEATISATLKGQAGIRCRP